MQRIANLFVDGAASFNEDHIGLFDDVLCRLVVEIEAKARAEMAQSLAAIANAPSELMHTLAKDEDIAVAGPVLTQSPRLHEHELVELAKTRSQAHLPRSPAASPWAKPSPTYWSAAAIPKWCATSPITSRRNFPMAVFRRW